MADTIAPNTEDLFQKDPHSAIICGQTHYDKTIMLELLEGLYRGVFHRGVILNRTVRYNKTYIERA